jgi:hypothetical protein
MDGLQAQIHPRVVPWSPDKPLDPVIATLSRVPNRIAVTITGGCARANMAYDEGLELLELFKQAFDGFAGAMLIGGSRMILDDDPTKVLFGITEVGAAIRTHCNDSFVLGVVPRLQEVVFYQAASMLKVIHTAGEADTPDHTTIIHPNQDIVVGVGKRLVLDRPIWDDEIEFRRYITETLRTYALWRSVLVAYNGGGTTEREVLINARQGWPVILVQGSGRATDKLAGDTDFLQAHPNVRVCQHSAASLRHELHELGAILDIAPKARYLNIA